MSTFDRHEKNFLPFPFPLSLCPCT